MLVTSASRSVRVIGRLKTDATIEQARAHLAAVWPAVREAALPPAYTGPRRGDFLSIGLDVTSASKGNERSLRTRYVQPLIILLGIASLVLIIACTNVASLLLSRTSVRRHEIGVRLAIGASRRRVERQLITEGVLLSLAGAVCGVALSFWACAEITGIVFEEYLYPIVFDGKPDMNVIGLTTVVAVAAGILCSALPAWQGTRGTATEALQTQGRTFSVSGRGGKMLVGAQLALSLVLLTTAGVLVRSLSELRALKTGIERSDNVFVGGSNRVETNFLYSMGRLAEAEDGAQIYRDLRMKISIDPNEMKVRYQKAPAWLRVLPNASLTVQQHFFGGRIRGYEIDELVQLMD
jgi:hypothetical protein